MLTLLVDINVLAEYTKLQGWRWRQYIPPKYWTSPRDVATKKTIFRKVIVFYRNFKNCYRAFKTAFDYPFMLTTVCNTQAGMELHYFHSFRKGYQRMFKTVIIIILVVWGITQVRWCTHISWLTDWRVKAVYCLHHRGVTSVRIYQTQDATFQKKAISIPALRN
jgi:hypothetical protein